MALADIWKKIVGTTRTQFGIGFDGPLLKDNAGDLEVRSADDVSLVNVSAATPTTDEHLATKLYVDTKETTMIVSRQADTTAAIPDNTAVRGFVVVTTAGSGAAIGDVLFDNGANDATEMILLVAVDGREIFVTTALTGGTIELDADAKYHWDGSIWLLISTVGGGLRMVRFAVGTASPDDSVVSIPAGNVVRRVRLRIDTSYDGGTTIEIGDTATVDLIGDSLDFNLQKPADTSFEVDQDTDWTINSVVRATITGAPAAGACTITVEYGTPDA